MNRARPCLMRRVRHLYVVAACRPAGERTQNGADLTCLADDYAASTVFLGAAGCAVFSAVKVLIPGGWGRELAGFRDDALHEECPSDAGSENQQSQEDDGRAGAHLSLRFDATRGSPLSVLAAFASHSHTKEKRSEWTQDKDAPIACTARSAASIIGCGPQM